MHDEVDGGHGPTLFDEEFQYVSGINAVPVVSLWVAIESLQAVLGSQIIDAVRVALGVAEWFFAGRSAENRNPFKLTRDEVASINLYTQETPLYRELNLALRSRNRLVLLEPFYHFLRIFLGALYKLPTRRMTLYRGVRKTVSEIGYDAKATALWWGCASATPSADVLQSPMFLGSSGKRILFHVTARAIDISPYSAFAEEDERLIQPGTRFHIKAILELGNDLSQVTLEEDETAESPFDFLPPKNRPTLDEIPEEVAANMQKQRRRMCCCGCILFIENLALIIATFVAAKTAVTIAPTIAHVGCPSPGVHLALPSSSDIGDTECSPSWTLETCRIWDGWGGSLVGYDKCNDAFGQWCVTNFTACKTSNSEAWCIQSCSPCPNWDAASCMSFTTTTSTIMARRSFVLA